MIWSNSSILGYVLPHKTTIPAPFFYIVNLRAQCENDQSITCSETADQSILQSD